MPHARLFLLVIAAAGATLPAAAADPPAAAPALPNPHPYPHPIYPPYPPVQVIVTNPTPPAGNGFSGNTTDPAAPNRPAPPERKAYVRVFVPEERASVTFNGHQTTSGGAMRLFETPQLPLGRTYTCTVTASWKQNGRTVTQERRVVVVPGQYAVANFVFPADTELIPAPPSSDYRSNR